MVSVKPGEKTGGAEFDGKPGSANAVAEQTPAGQWVPYNYTDVAALVAAAPVGQGFNANWDTGEELFKARVDMTAVGNSRDCGECHVGGGGMEFLPRNLGWDGSTGDRVSLRDNAGLTAADYTSFNYFIDTFDEDGDGDKNEALWNDYTKTGVVEMDCLMCHMTGYSWSDAKAAKRVGKFGASASLGAQIATSSTAYDNYGSDTLAAMPVGYGTSVAYGAGVTVDASNNATADFSAIEAVPPADNCGVCHQGKYQVDWKKRGEMAPGNDVHAALGCMGCHERKLDPTTALTATGIAEGGPDTTAANVGTSLNMKSKWDHDNDPATDPVFQLGHDPAKGGAGYWDNLANQIDWKEFKTCADCHFGNTTSLDENGDVVTVNNLGSRGKSFGAPNPDAAHAAAGLSALVVQDGRDGVADKSHIDLIHCTACHITKSSEAPHDLDPDNHFPAFNQTETYVSGGAFVDGTGPDHEGRLAVHDTPYSSRPMFVDNGDGTYDSGFGYNWGKDGKIHAANMHTSFFIRDKNDVNFDANVDGRAHGMDAVLPTHILANANVMKPGHPDQAALLYDGVSTGNEITTYLTTLTSNLPTYTGKAGTAKLKLSWLTVAFTMSHQIEPASVAFGASGCTDCHGANPKNGGFFNGTIDMEGYATFGFNKDQTTPMTKVQGGTEKTFHHPNQKDKFKFISIPVMSNNGTDSTNGASAVPPNSTNVIRDLDRSEILYEATFRTRNKAWFDTITGGDMVGTSMVPSSGLGTTWKGWLLKLEVCDEVADPTCASPVSRSMMIGPSSGSAYANIDDTPSITDLLAVMPSQFTTGTEAVADVADAGSTAFGFYVKDNGNEGIKIVTEAGTKVRISPQSNYGAFKIAGNADTTGNPASPLMTAPIIPTCKGIDADDSLAGRSEMIAYLVALGNDDDADGYTNAEECFGMVPMDDVAIEASVGGVTSTGGNGMIYVEANAGSPVSIVQPAESGFTYTTYYQNLENNEDEGTSVAVDGSGVGSITFAEAGTYRIVTEAVNVEGKLVKDIQYVTVAGALNGATNFAPVVTGQSVDLTLNNLPAGSYDSILINWADGTAQDFYEIVPLDPVTLVPEELGPTADASETLSNAYPAAMTGQTVRVNVAIYNGQALVDAWAGDITLQ